MDDDGPDLDTTTRSQKGMHNGDNRRNRHQIGFAGIDEVDPTDEDEYDNWTDMEEYNKWASED